MNVELLNRVKAHILEEPKRLFMPGFLARKGDDEDVDRYPACGTIGCYAGWICVLSGEHDLFGKELADKAASLAHINLDQADRLFFSHVVGWSEQDNAKLWSGDGTPETAALAARRLDEFIASGGAI